MIIISKNDKIPSEGLWMGGEGGGNLNSCPFGLGLPPLFNSVYGLSSVLGLVRGWGATLDRWVFPRGAECVSPDTANWSRCARLTTRNRKQIKHNAISVNKLNDMLNKLKIKFLHWTDSSNTTWAGPRNSSNRKETVKRSSNTLLMMKNKGTMKRYYRPHEPGHKDKMINKNGNMHPLV
jgi:hypothetical protein